MFPQEEIKLIHTAERCCRSPPVDVLLLLINPSHRARSDFIHHKEGLIVDLKPPLNFWLIVETNHEVGHELEEVLPQAQEEVQVEVADVYLAVNPRVIHVAHALKTVHVVDTETSVHTRVRGTFIHVLLTPERKIKKKKEKGKKCCET